MGITSRDESNMKTHVLISFLLVCSASGSSATNSSEDRSDNANGTSEDAASMAEAYNVLKNDNENNIPDLMDISEMLFQSQGQTEEDLPNLVFFYLYTRANPNNPDILTPNNVGALKRSHFNPARPTVISTHGWRSSATSDVCTLIRDAYLQHGDYNVILVDWSKISKKEYFWASRRVVTIAQYVSSLINFLADQGMRASQLTIVGHSLGAHVAGLSSYYATVKANYIVGLDPAQPNFHHVDERGRISTKDGQYVMIIHTNADVLGFSNALGDADFYPNGGSVQPGCPLDNAVACSHTRSYYLFAESINSNKGFWAVSCSNFLKFEANICKSAPTALMGGAEPNFNVRGTFYLRTASSPPYAEGR